MVTLRIVLSAAAVAVLSQAGHAVTSPTAGGPCLPPLPSVSAENAAQFLQQPAALLDGFKAVPGGLAASVRDLASMRPESVDGIPALANAASPAELSAIGAGLGTAAAICTLAQPATAQRIQEAVLKADKADLARAFTSIVGDLATEAIPDLPLNGEATPGGGRGTTASPQVGGGSTTVGATGFPGAVIVGSSAARNAVQTALAASVGIVVTSVSPAR